MSDSTIHPAPLRRAAQVAGWSMLLLGVGHLVSFAAAAGRYDDATRRALDGLEQATVSMPGLTHTLADLFTGYNLMVAALPTTVGVLMLLMARYAEQVPGLLVSVLWVMVAFTTVGLVISWLFLPLPPLVGMSVALVAGLVGLLQARRPGPRGPAVG